MTISGFIKSAMTLADKKLFYWRGGIIFQNEIYLKCQTGVLQTTANENNYVKNSFLLHCSPYHF